MVYLIALVIGVYAARYRGGAFDLTSGVVMLGLWSIPVMWAGVMLQGFFSIFKFEQSKRGSDPSQSFVDLGPSIDLPTPAKVATSARGTKEIKVTHCSV